MLDQTVLSLLVRRDVEVGLQTTAARAGAVDIPSDWKVLKAFPFGEVRHGAARKSDMHITLIEAITFCLLVRNITSRVSSHAVVSEDPARDCLVDHGARKIFFGLDSQGAHGAFAKGRSSARRLNRSCRRVCALSLASSVVCFFFWIPSEI